MQNGYVWPVIALFWLFLSGISRFFVFLRPLTLNRMFRVLFSILPLLVCLVWLVIFGMHYKALDTAKRILTWFMAVCVVLYSCHAIYFNFYPCGLPAPLEALWALCSLSVYPIYFIYICALSARPQGARNKFLFLLPAILVSAAIFVWPCTVTDNVRKMVNMFQVFGVCYYGYRRLVEFDRQLADVYADMEGRDTRHVKALLLIFMATSVLSSVANAIGKQYFVSDVWLVLVIFAPFAVMLFMLGYIGYTRNFSTEQYVADSAEPVAVAEDALPMEEDEDKMGLELDRLIREEKMFLQKNLKISDVAVRVGSCRTYVSNYINQHQGCSFSDYINRLRIEHAQQLLTNGEDTKMVIVAEQSGFSNEPSFYRNFRKFTGMNPGEWVRSQQR